MVCVCMCICMRVCVWLCVCEREMHTDLLSYTSPPKNIFEMRNSRIRDREMEVGML